MEKLPRDVNIELVKLLPYSQIKQFCQTDEKWNNICQSDYIYLFLLERDYPKLNRLVNKKSDKYIHTLYIDLDNLIEVLLTKEIIANPKYIKLDVMEEDLRKVIDNKLAKIWRSKSVDRNDISVSIYDVLTALKYYFIGDSSKGKLDLIEMEWFSQDTPIDIFLNKYKIKFDD